MQDLAPNYVSGLVVMSLAVHVSYMTCELSGQGHADFENTLH